MVDWIVPVPEAAKSHAPLKAAIVSFMTTMLLKVWPNPGIPLTWMYEGPVTAALAPFRLSALKKRTVTPAGIWMDYTSAAPFLSAKDERIYAKKISPS